MKKISAITLTLLMAFTVAVFSVSAADTNVAAIGEEKYESLAAAIVEADAGDTITLLSNVTENVTINKNLIIDGDDNNYTGKMTISKSINLTVEDVNFVEGNVVKGKSTGTTGVYTFKDCSFFSEAKDVYAIEIRGSGNIIIEDCTSDGYMGFLQVPSTNTSTSIKNVTIKNTGYAIKIDYSNGVTLENVTITDSSYGFVNSNFGTKTIAVKNCTIKANNPIVIWDRNTKLVNTFKFEGKNDFGANDFYYNAVTEEEKAYTKFVLADTDSTWTAVAGLDVTNADYDVRYIDGTYLVKFVAQNGTEKYTSLAAAITDANAGDTITLLSDVTENVTINKNLTIDGDDNDYTGKMTISKSINLTVEDVNFVEGNVVKGKSTGTTGVYTFKDCSFFSEARSVYAIEIRGSGSIVIEGCTFDGYLGALQVPSTNTSTSIKDVTIKNTGYAIKVDYSSGVLLENVTITDSSYGFVNSNFGPKTIAVKNCTIKANNPIVIWDRNTKIVNTFKFEGKNDFGANDFYYNTVTEDEKAYTKFVLADIDSTWTAVEGLEVTADYDVWYVDGTYMVKFAAQVGDKKYLTIRDAVAAAKDGDVITVIADHTLANNKLGATVEGMYPYIDVTDKKVTIDLNGKTVTVNPDLDANMLAVFYAAGTGELTLKDSSEAQTGTVNVTMADGTKAYSMFTALNADGAKMYIESGNYSIDKVEAGQSMIYAGQDQQIFVSGGNFYLGNAKTKDPGNGAMQPWIYNAHGDGIKFITVTGGTYNVDPTHYHGEAHYPGCYNAVEEAADKWTVKIVHTPGAAATCQAPQLCTICEIELDAIKDHSYETYVSDENATCTADGTKTAECIYACGKTDTVVDEGTMKPHVPGATATCQAPQTCTGCDKVFVDIVKHEFVDYVSDNNATCTTNCTKTAACIYGCGKTDTVEIEGTAKGHNDLDEDGRCNGCDSKFCDSCGKVHDTFLQTVICLIVDFIRLITSFFSSVFKK